MLAYHYALLYNYLSLRLIFVVLDLKDNGREPESHLGLLEKSMHCPVVNTSYLIRVILHNKK